MSNQPASQLPDHELAELARGIAGEFAACSKEARTQEVLRELAKRLRPTAQEQVLAEYDRYVRPHIAHVCHTLAQGESWLYPGGAMDVIEPPGSPSVQHVLRIAAEELDEARAAVAMPEDLQVATYRQALRQALLDLNKAKGVARPLMPTEVEGLVEVALRNVQAASTGGHGDE